MFVLQKNLAAVDADAFKDAIAVQQAMVKNADDSLFLGDQFSSQIDLQRHR